MLGLCGCGSSGDTATEAPMPTSMEETTAAQEASVGDAADAAAETVANSSITQDQPTPGTKVDELVDSWVSGTLTDDDIENMYSEGEIDSETYVSVFRILYGDDWEPEEAQGKATIEPETPVASVDINLSEIMTEHVFEDEDLDGYRTQNTVYLSPIFRESDMDTLVAVWEALGGNADEIPIGEECYNWDSKLQRSLERSGFSGSQYIVGSWEILNCTEGFDLTPDSPRSFLLNMRMEPDDNALPSGVYEAISQCSTTYIFFDTGIEKSKSERGILPFGSAFMNSNQWGPTLFIIVLPDKVAPNLPNGYDCHNLLFDFGAYLSDDKFYIPYYNKLY